jgi:hypothetical protein
MRALPCGRALALVLVLATSVVSVAGNEAPQRVAWACGRALVGGASACGCELPSRTHDATSDCMASCRSAHQSGGRLFGGMFNRREAALEDGEAPDSWIDVVKDAARLLSFACPRGLRGTLVMNNFVARARSLSHAHTHMAQEIGTRTHARTHTHTHVRRLQRHE